MHSSDVVGIIFVFFPKNEGACFLLEKRKERVCGDWVWCKSLEECKRGLDTKNVRPFQSILRRSLLCLSIRRRVAGGGRCVVWWVRATSIPYVYRNTINQLFCLACKCLTC